MDAIRAPVALHQAAHSLTWAHWLHYPRGHCALLMALDQRFLPLDSPPALRLHWNQTSRPLTWFNFQRPLTLTNMTIYMHMRLPPHRVTVPPVCTKKGGAAAKLWGASEVKWPHDPFGVNHLSLLASLKHCLADGTMFRFTLQHAVFQERRLLINVVG